MDTSVQVLHRTKGNSIKTIIPLILADRYASGENASPQPNAAVGTSRGIAYRLYHIHFDNAKMFCGLISEKSYRNSMEELGFLTHSQYHAENKINPAAHSPVPNSIAHIR